LLSRLIFNLFFIFHTSYRVGSTIAIFGLFKIYYKLQFTIYNLDLILALHAFGTATNPILEFV